jgi:hypothetical protein
VIVKSTEFSGTSMSNGNSPRTFHLPYYPLGGVHREGNKTPTTDEHPTSKSLEKGKEKSQRKCTSIVVKRPKKRSPGKPRIKLAKRKKSTPPTGDDAFEQGEQLLEFWQSKYEETFGVPYEIGTSSKRLSLCDQILERLKTPERVQIFMLCLLTHPDMAWCGQKTLEFLVKPSNQSRIAPILSRRRKNRSRAEYTGERPTTTKITFRSI